MKSRRVYDQAMTIFGTFMIFFYLGLAYILVFSSLFTHIEKTFRLIFATPLFLYGIFRAVIAYQKIKENFFDKDDN
jgi:uncharacterized membrane protein (DUF373 family)